MKKEKSIFIPLEDGGFIEAVVNDYDGLHPEICVYKTDQNGNVVQDIAIIRGERDKNFDVVPESGNMEVLIWSDSNDEDYTHKFDIAAYVEE